MSNDKINTRDKQWGEISNGYYTGLIKQVGDVAEARERAETETDVHALADRLRELKGAFGAAKNLIPMMVARQKAHIVRRLEIVLATAAEMTSKPFSDEADMRGLRGWCKDLISRVESEGEDLIKVESELNRLEDALESYRRVYAENEFNFVHASVMGLLA